MINIPLREQEILNSVQESERVSREIQKGNFFTGSFYASGISNTDSSYLLISGGSKRRHSINTFTATGGPCECFLHEDPGIDSYGTKIESHSRNRRIGSTDVVLFKNPSVSGTGAATSFESVIAGSRGPGNANIGSETIGRAEIIELSATNYLLEIENRSGSDQDAFIRTSWYEGPEGNKNV